LIQFLVASLGLAGCHALGCHFDYEFKVFSSDAVRGILSSMAFVILPVLAVSLYTVTFFYKFLSMLVQCNWKSYFFPWFSSGSI